MFDVLLLTHGMPFHNVFLLINMFRKPSTHSSELCILCFEAFLPSQVSWMWTVSPTSRESCFSPLPTKFHFTTKQKGKHLSQSDECLAHLKINRWIFY